MPCPHVAGRAHRLTQWTLAAARLLASALAALRSEPASRMMSRAPAAVILCLGAKYVPPWGSPAPPGGRSAPPRLLLSSALRAPDLAPARRRANTTPPIAATAPTPIAAPIPITVVERPPSMVVSSFVREDVFG